MTAKKKLIQWVGTNTYGCQLYFEGFLTLQQKECITVLINKELFRG